MATRRRFELRHFSIKDRFIIVYGVAVLIPVLLLSVVSYVLFARIIEDRSIRYAVGMLEQIRNNIDADIEQIDLASYIIFANPDILRILKYEDSIRDLEPWQRYSTERLLTEVMFSRRDIHSITLFDLVGQSVTTSAVQRPVSFAVVSEAADRADGSFAWLERERTTDTIPVVRLVRDMEMRPVGYLRFDVRAQSLREKLSDETVAVGGGVYIIRGDTPILSARSDESPPAGLGAFPRDATVTQIRKDREILATYPSRANDWTYVGVIPLGQITRDADAIRNTTLALGVLSFVAFNFLSILIVRRFTDPIHQIAEQMKHARTLDWSPSIEYDGNDEIAYLARQFTEMVRRLNTLVNDVVEERSRHARHELVALQSQINPHFLYNTLEIINWMSIDLRVPRIGEIVRALSDMMRYSISYTRDLVPVSMEVDHVRKYLLIQKTRFEGRFDVEYRIDETVLECEIPKFTLQPIVENAIVHGFRGMAHSGTITVTGQRSDDAVTLEVRDNGVGIDPEVARQVTATEWAEYSDSSIGIANVHRRIQLIYGPGFGVTVARVEDGGTVCAIRVPVRSAATTGVQQGAVRA